ncbi:MAG: ABC transporter ATP-binding protein [Spirochaetaceae bacterium]|jgi:oligopeptide/dipeptide ABC transporter ATP-binding protein|nr:ABC transporter ATP-binding protein [Spirochaetaceae bacterium]
MIPLVEIDDLSVDIVQGRGANTKVLPILRHIDLSVEEGRVLGIVGESGCGKTMTVLALMGLLPEGGRISGGRIRFRGRDITGLSRQEMENIRGKRIAMIFQEPRGSLNPLLSIGAQMREILYYHEGIKGKANKEKCIFLLRTVNISEPEKVYDYYPFKLSGGMCQRVMIAMALACEPELIIADEPTTALDVTTQAQILDLFNEIRGRIRSSFIFVTHDLGVIAEIADRTAVIYAGYVVEESSAAALFGRPLHPYTDGLMRSRLGRRNSNRENLYSIPGVVPVSGNMPSGCPFTPRCAYTTEQCRREIPPLAVPLSQEIESGHKVRCWRQVP